MVLKFFVERTDFTKSLMSTKKQLNIIVNKKKRGFAEKSFISLKWTILRME